MLLTACASQNSKQEDDLSTPSDSDTGLDADDDADDDTNDDADDDADDDNDCRGDRTYADAISCSRILGSLTIGADADPSLSGLETLEYIRDDLLITAEAPVVDLSGLNGLYRIDGMLSIQGTQQLTTLTGIDNLEHVETGIHISENTVLESLEGLNSLRSCEGWSDDYGDFYPNFDATSVIADNPALVNLYGLSGLLRCYQLAVSDNESLTALFASPEGMRIEGMHLFRNPSLTSLDSLRDVIWQNEGWGEWANDLTIADNEALTDISGLGDIDGIRLGLSGPHVDANLQSIAGFDIRSIKITDSMISDIDALLETGTRTVHLNNVTGLARLDGFTGLAGLSLENIPGLTSLSGLNAYDLDYLTLINLPDLTTLTGLPRLSDGSGRHSTSLKIKDNPQLVNLIGLEATTELYDLNVAGNPALTSLAGLENIESVYELSVVGNPALTSLAGLENIETILKGIDISDNSALESIAHLEGLTDVSVNVLTIIDNAVLENLDGLEGLQSVTFELTISDNPTLVDISGLHSLEEATTAGYGTGLSVLRNEQLCESLISEMIAIIGPDNVDIGEIADNDDGC